MGDQPCRMAGINTDTEETRTDIHASTGIRTDDPRVVRLKTSDGLGLVATGLLSCK
jgi:hypothetical protein